MAVLGLLKFSKNLRPGYPYSTSSQKNIIFKVGSCEAALCECDRQFAIAHEAVTDVFVEDYHLFWSKTGWNPEGQCQRGGGGDSDPQCCGGNRKNSAFVSIFQNLQNTFDFFIITTFVTIKVFDSSSKNVIDLKLVSNE